MPPARKLSRTSFRAIALASLFFPGIVTYSLASRAYSAGGGGALGVLLVVLVLLVAVLLWAVALLPLRNRTDLTPLTLDLSAQGRADLFEQITREKASLRDMAEAADPALRRRYHLQIAAGGAALTLALGVGVFAMFLGDRIFISLLLAAILAPLLTGYHLLRALLVRGR